MAMKRIPKPNVLAIVGDEAKLKALKKGTQGNRSNECTVLVRTLTSGAKLETVPSANGAYYYRLTGTDEQIQQTMSTIKNNQAKLLMPTEAPAETPTRRDGEAAAQLVEDLVESGVPGPAGSR